MTTHLSLLGRRAFVGSVLSIVCLLSAGLSASQLFRRGPSYQVFRDPAGRFELEYPKDWRVLPSGGSSLATFVSNDGPTLFIDHVKLAERMNPAEIEVMAENDAERLKREHPTGKDFKPASLETKAGRGALIRYARVESGPEVVVHSSIPVGLDLFRVYGVLPEKQVSKYEPIVMHMIESFKAPADPAGAKTDPAGVKK
jgi:hypothetical protein